MTALIQAPNLACIYRWAHHTRPDFRRKRESVMAQHGLLSGRETEILRRVNRGFSNQEIHGGARIAERKRNRNSSASQSRIQQSRDRRPVVDHGGNHEGAFASDFWQARRTQSNGGSREGAGIGLAVTRRRVAGFRAPASLAASRCWRRHR